MRLFGYEVSFRKALPSASSLYPVDSFGNAWRVLETFTGSWQQDVAPVDAATILRNWAVFSCQTLIAQDVAKLGVKLTKWDERKQIYVTIDSPAVTPFLTKPNGYQTTQKFLESWIHSKASDGNTYVLKVRDARNVVVEGHVLQPHCTTPLVSESGDVFYRLGYDRLSGVLETDVVVPASEIMHDRYHCLFHPLVGIAPPYAISIAATQGIEILKHSERFFRNAAVPGGLLVTPQRIDDNLAKKFKESFETNYGGANRGRVAVLGNGLEYKQITQTAVDSELTKQSTQSAEMICSAYHVPPYKIGLGPMPTYDNAETLNLIYYGDCLQPLVQSVEACLTEGLDLQQKGYRAELDEDDLLRMDKKSQIEFVAKGVERAIFSPDEGRRRFNMPPVKGGASPYLQQQNYSLEALAKRDAQADPFATAKPSQPVPDEDPEAAGAKLLADTLISKLQESFIVR